VSEIYHQNVGCPDANYYEKVTEAIGIGHSHSLPHRGTVRRTSRLVYRHAYGALEVPLEDVIHDAITYAELAKRKDVPLVNVFYALKRQDSAPYGFGG
ncbi:Histone H4 type VIII, partial [Taenia solium]